MCNITRSNTRLARTCRCESKNEVRCAFLERRPGALGGFRSTVGVGALLRQFLCTSEPRLPNGARALPKVVMAAGIYTARTEEARASLEGFEYSLLHRTVFVYGALMAEEALEALLVPASGRSARNRAKRAGKAHGYGRWCMVPTDGSDVVLPAALPAGPMVRCDGLLLELMQPSEMRAIDAYMDKRMDRLAVRVTVENGFGGHEEVEALMYVCPSSLANDVLQQPLKEWNYNEFRSQHLRAFVDSKVKPCRAQFDLDEKAAADKAQQAAS